MFSFKAEELKNFADGESNRLTTMKQIVKLHSKIQSMSQILKFLAKMIETEKVFCEKLESFYVKTLKAWKSQKFGLVFDRL